MLSFETSLSKYDFKIKFITILATIITSDHIYIITRLLSSHCHSRTMREKEPVVVDDDEKFIIIHQFTNFGLKSTNNSYLLCFKKAYNLPLYASMLKLARPVA